MTNVEARIEGSDKLTSIFGFWPSFHDAEVIELNFWRGNVDPGADTYDFPVLTVKIHLWEMTDDVNRQGYFGRQKHTLTTIRFHDVDEFTMEGFNHQNAILGLDIIEEQRAQGPTPVCEKGLQHGTCDLELVKSHRARLGELLALHRWRRGEHGARHALLPPPVYDFRLQPAA
jgi:Immunity protein 50